MADNEWVKLVVKKNNGRVWYDADSFSTHVSNRKILDDMLIPLAENYRDLTFDVHTCDIKHKIRPNNWF